MYLYRKTIINAPTCLTIGNFDGVHLGHLQILKQLQHLANEIPLLTGLLSFHPHPKSLFGHPPQLITPFRQQYQALKNSQCLDLWYLQKFDHLFANQSVEDFIRWLVMTFNPKIILVGDDFRFGKNRSGDFHALKSQGLKHEFSVHCLETIYEIDQGNGQNEQTPRRVSSTWLRQLLQNGDVNYFYDLTHRHFSLSGYVIHGRKLARTIGFPTANINPQQLKPNRELALKFGVYHVTVYDKNQDKRYQGIANWGIKPTIKHGNTPLLEVHILDGTVDLDLYGKNITVTFLDFIRPEMKFDNIEALKKQIHQDIMFCTTL